MFIPDADGTNGAIKFELSAETGAYPAPLVSASLIGQGGVRISGNKLAGVEFKKDSPLKVILQPGLFRLLFYGGERVCR